MSEKPDGFGNWCPDCGEPRGVCTCDTSELWLDDEWVDEDIPTCSCPYCYCGAHVDLEGAVCDGCTLGEHQG